MKSYSHRLPVNETIGGRYRIQDVLGEGGFGITYKAWDEKLERLVVIKEYLPGEMGVRDGDTLRVIPRTNREEDFLFGLKRYLDEAKALARFQHPNIVRIIDHLEANGTAYIVMEYEQGETLSEHLKRRGGQMSEQEILDLSLSLLQGLREVHKAGMLHRDIKPGNIFLRKAGGPLLIDFGAARHALGEHSKSLSAIVSQGYAPPEQYSNRSKQGPYTDLYAIGAVLYELITGKTPPESVERGHNLNEGEPDPLNPASRVAQGQVSQWLLELDDWLLRIPSKERPQDCEEVVTEIRKHWGGSHPDPAPEPRPEPGPVADPQTRLVAEDERFLQNLDPSAGRRRQQQRLALLAGGVLVAIVALGGGTYLLLRGGKEPPTSIVVTGMEPKIETPAAAAPERQQPSEEPQAEKPKTEEEVYADAKYVNTSYAYQLFLRKYPDPNGAFAKEARGRLNKLRN